MGSPPVVLFPRRRLIELPEILSGAGVTVTSTPPIRNVNPLGALAIFKCESAGGLVTRVTCMLAEKYSKEGMVLLIEDISRGWSASSFARGNRQRKMIVLRLREHGATDLIRDQE
jgi:hypothetical protein